MTIPFIISHAFWPRKLITNPAALSTKPTIEAMRPRRIPAILLTRFLKPFPTPLTTNFRPLVNALTIILIVVPIAKTTAETVKVYFLKMFLTLYRGDNQVLPSHSEEHQSALDFSYPFSCSFSHILVFILIICNPLILQNRLQQLLNSFSFRAIKTSHSGPSEVFISLGVMDSTFTFLYPFLHSTMELSCPDQTSLPATFLFYLKKSQVPKPLPQDKFF